MQSSAVTPFSPEYRDQLSLKLALWAESDSRLTAAAIVGSLAHSQGDRWSDLDLTFAVAPGVSLNDMVDAWTGKLISEEGGLVLFDLHAGASLYRVFILPGLLQVDLSFTPEDAFAQQGQAFRLLFGTAKQTSSAGPATPSVLVGYAVHHLLRARICMERGRLFKQSIGYILPGTMHFRLHVRLPDYRRLMAADSTSFRTNLLS